MEKMQSKSFFFGHDFFFLKRKCEGKGKWKTLLSMERSVIKSFISFSFWFLFMKSQFRSRRKASGGRYKATRKKKINFYKGTGGEVKRSLARAEEANVFDGSKHKKVKILSVVENKANRHFVRRNLITKGAVIKTEIGNAVVVNRPGQEGFINAVLVK